MKQEIFNRALDALNEFMLSHGAAIFEPPTIDLSETDGEFVYLNNRSASFGKYEIETGEFISADEE